MANRPGQCKSCGKAIFWVKTRAGRMMPVDVAKTTVFDLDGDAATGHLSHFATCAHADAHRKRKPASGGPVATNSPDETSQGM